MVWWLYVRHLRQTSLQNIVKKWFESKCRIGREHKQVFKTCLLRFYWKRFCAHDVILPQLTACCNLSSPSHPSCSQSSYRSDSQTLILMDFMPRHYIDSTVFKCVNILHWYSFPKPAVSVLFVCFYKCIIHMMSCECTINHGGFAGEIIVMCVSCRFWSFLTQEHFSVRWRLAQHIHKFSWSVGHLKCCFVFLKCLGILRKDCGF